MRYFFHLTETGCEVIDEEGREFAGLDEVLAAAIGDARSVIAAEALKGKLPLRSRIEVEDEQGSRVLVLPFDQAVLFDG